METTIEKACDLLRQEIKAVEVAVLALKTDPVFQDEGSPNDAINRGEMTANIMLAYRHLEDSRMRLGKVMQAYQGGLSILDRSAEEITEIKKRLEG